MNQLADIRFFSKQNVQLIIPNDDRGLWFGGQQVDSTPINQNMIFIETVQKIFNAMKKTIIALRRNLDYNAHYNAFLLDQITEKEFEKISNDFAISTNNQCTDDIKSEIQLLIKMTGEQFTPSEISDIFHIDEIEAEKELENLEF